MRLSEKNGTKMIFKILPNTGFHLYMLHNNRFYLPETLCAHSLRSICTIKLLWFFGARKVLTKFGKYPWKSLIARASTIICSGHGNIWPLKNIEMFPFSNRNLPFAYREILYAMKTSKAFNINKLKHAKMVKTITTAIMRI